MVLGVEYRQGEGRKKEVAGERVRNPEDGSYMPRGVNNTLSGKNDAPSKLHTETRHKYILGHGTTLIHRT